MENPNEEERTQFLYPIFMQNAYNKCGIVLDNAAGSSRSMVAHNSHGDQALQSKGTNPLVHATQLSGSSFKPNDIDEMCISRSRSRKNCRKNRHTTSETEKHRTREGNSKFV